jgi:ribosomal protein S18 acetylase RimI-like enzyme
MVVIVIDRVAKHLPYPQTRTPTRPALHSRADPIVLTGYSAARLRELVLLWRASFEAGVGVAEPHSIDDQQQYFLDHVLPQNEVCLALGGAALLGFVAASRESVNQLYIHPAQRRCGIGTQLLDWAKARSAGSLWLYTFARNAAARAFYRRSGFVEVAHGFEPMWQLDDVKLQWTAPSLDSAA